MGRGKIEVKKIENITNRQVTFCKRRQGLQKKAQELAVLCDAEVAFVICSARGKHYEYSSHGNIRRTIERFKNLSVRNNNGFPTIETTTQSDTLQHKKQEAIKLKQENESMRETLDQMLGKGISSLKQKDLKQLEQKLDKGYRKVRKRKEEALFEEIERARRMEVYIQEQNEQYRAMIMDSQCNQNIKIVESQFNQMTIPHPHQYDELQSFDHPNFIHSNLVNVAQHFSNHEQTALQLR